MAPGADEATHVLVLFAPATSRDEEREVRRIYGPLTEAGANELGETLRDVAPGAVFYEVIRIQRPPLMLTDVGRQARRAERRA